MDSWTQRSMSISVQQKEVHSENMKVGNPIVGYGEFKSKVVKTVAWTDGWMDGLDR